MAYLFYANTRFKGRDKSLPFFILLWLIPLSNVNAQNITLPCPDEFTEAIRVICDYRMEGRATGSAGEAKTASFLKEFLLGKSRMGVNGHPFYARIDNDSIHSENVIASLDNGSERTVLFMAHYDHIGLGGPLSRSPFLYTVHPGADDNASGVGLMLSIAVCEQLPKNLNYLFAAVSGHEVGLYGSKELENHLKQIPSHIILVINLDMVGRMNQQNHLYVESNSEDMRVMLEDAALNSNIVLKRPPRPRLLQLDSKWFAAAGIPTITMTTGVHLDYHMPSDSFENLNLGGISHLQNMLSHFLHLLGGAN